MKTATRTGLAKPTTSTMPLATGNEMVTMATANTKVTEVTPATTTNT